MAKIYEDAKDLHVVATYVYKKTGETKAYKDDDLTIQYTTSELKEVFIKGALIVLEDDSLVKPVGYSETESVGSVSYVIDSSGATIATLAAVADPA